MPLKATGHLNSTRSWRSFTTLVSVESTLIRWTFSGWKLKPCSTRRSSSSFASSRSIMKEGRFLTIAQGKMLIFGLPRSPALPHSWSLSTSIYWRASTRWPGYTFWSWLGVPVSSTSSTCGLATTQPSHRRDLLCSSCTRRALFTSLSLAVWPTRSS